jgi:hypothetical protein
MPFKSQFDHLTVLSSVEGLTVPSLVQGEAALTGAFVNGEILDCRTASKGIITRLNSFSWEGNRKMAREACGTPSPLSG